jgi:hypothetical protein
MPPLSERIQALLKALENDLDATMPIEQLRQVQVAVCAILQLKLALDLAAATKDDTPPPNTTS